MKLYATTTSERASKGQGGNNYLNIEIFTGKDKKRLLWINVNETNIAIFSNDDEKLIVNSFGSMASISTIPTEKVNKQKGEPIDEYMRKRREARAKGGHVQYQS